MRPRNAGICSGAAHLRILIHCDRVAWDERRGTRGAKFMMFHAEKSANLRQHGLSLSRVLAALCLLLAGAAEAVAQGADCGRLQAQIASTGRGNTGQSSKYAAAANDQLGQADRLAAQAQAMGCNNRQFLIFGSAPPAQCGGVLARIQQLRSSAASFAAQARSVSGESQRKALQARFDANCRGGQPVSRGFFDSLFGEPQRRVERYEDGGRLNLPIEPMRRDDGEEEGDGIRRGGGSTAVCVRTCDGGFFPVSYSARRRNIEDLADMCRALCPNVETTVYTFAPSRDIDSAVAEDGSAYTSLRNAGKYRTKFDPTCTCKPPNKSWVEALADAEALLGRAPKTDIIVTPEKADLLSRAKDSPKDALRTTQDATATATTPQSARGRKFGLEDGQKLDGDGANGERKRVRVLSPNL